jgi:hypothetical protein
MSKCWCGKDHEQDRGDIRNGEMTHGVFNWKLYELRMIDMDLVPFPEVELQKAEQLELIPA